MLSGAITWQPAKANRCRHLRYWNPAFLGKRRRRAYSSVVYDTPRSGDLPATEFPGSSWYGRMQCMAQPLEHVTVAILEHRYTKEFSTLFERLGATVRACPLLEEKPLENRDELQKFVRRVIAAGLDVMIFLTGV